jgi:adenylylsulfate kinase-like enzyme
MSRVVWITGRPASGKTTLARAIVAELERLGEPATLVDSDEVRAVITPEATYTPEERLLVYRTIAYIARRLDLAGTIPIVAATANAEGLRAEAKRITGGYSLVLADAPLATCEARDPKGLYRRAREGHATTLPGVGAAFDRPDDADLVVGTEHEAPEVAARRVVSWLLPRWASAGA